MHALAIAVPPHDLPVDPAKRYIPEQLTPLFHTRSYADLTADQRLRYNQLHALYFNEQIMFFETVLGRTVLQALLRDPWPRRLAEILQRFHDEERQHTEMFRQLNRRCAPRLYGGGDLHFVQASAGSLACLRWAAARPARFPLFLWLMLLQEERALFYSRAYIGGRDLLEPHFVAAHRRHLADEVWHVRWDEELIDQLWRRAGPVLRTINARLFAWMLEEFFGTPKRAQLRVVDELARELPELGARRRELRRQLLALSHDQDYRRTLYCREMVPITFAHFDAAPELRRLGLCGHRPWPEGVR
ncbi:MAG TPA: diiron oxygenase [Thermoanaerobaculia bacterium]|jgi:hypothetical protein|nr:diiron oxygenase [Thermoanaerobaculia bacterium]